MSIDKNDSFSSLDNLNIIEEDEAAMPLAITEAITTDSTLMSQSPLCQGYLFKESTMHKAFNKRYFVLYQHLLVYYREMDQFIKGGTPEARLVSYVKFSIVCLYRFSVVWCTVLSNRASLLLRARCMCMAILLVN